MQATLFLRTNLHPNSLAAAQQYFSVVFFSLIMLMFDGKRPDLKALHGSCILMVHSAQYRPVAWLKRLACVLTCELSKSTAQV